MCVEGGNPAPDARVRMAAPFCASKEIILTDVTFASLGVAEPLQRALVAENYLHPTPIQTQAIPLVLSGRDVLGIAQTGTGKTAAFGLPLLQRLGEIPAHYEARGVRALILAPTRELALQIGDSLKSYGRNLKLRHAVILGGVNQNKQVAAVRNGVDILVATPGRLLDLVDQKHVRLNTVSTLIIDEADRMFDMGFLRDVRRIVSLVPRKRQSLLFSATMPPDVAKLVTEVLIEPVRVDVAPKAVTADRIEQNVHFVQTKDKRALLSTLLDDRAMARVLVFTRTKHGANKVADHLEKSGHAAEVIHGNKSQNARVRALEQFRSGRARILVATDIAARGIDVDEVTHVINFELPEVAENYVHRIGRTARAGNAGIAISFCDSSEKDSLRSIERLIKRSLRVVGDEPRPNREAAKPASSPRSPHPPRPAGQHWWSKPAGRRPAHRVA
jgi:ATP-dependent RNA helicase RhlE